MASPSANQHLIRGIAQIVKGQKKTTTKTQQQQPTAYKSKVTEAGDSYLQKVFFYTVSITDGRCENWSHSFNQHSLLACLQALWHLWDISGAFSIHVP